MDGENNGNPYKQMDDLGGKTHHFRKHPDVFSIPTETQETQPQHRFQRKISCSLLEAVLP